MAREIVRQDHRRRSRSPRHRSSSGEHHRHKPSNQSRHHRPSSEEHDRRKSSRDRKPSPSSSEDRRRRRPPSRPTKPKPSFGFNLFGRGRERTRDNHRHNKSSLVKRPSSRSTSRGTSRSTSREGTTRHAAVPSYIPNLDPRKLPSPLTPSGPSVGFAIPRETPVPSSRLGVHFYLSIASLIGLSSIASAVPPPSRTEAEISCLALLSLSFALSFVIGVGLRYDPSRRTLTSPLFRPGTPLSHVSIETLLNTLQLVLCCLTAGVAFASPLLANESSSSIWNTNLYYSVLSTLGFSSYLAADSITAESGRVYWGTSHNFKPCALKRSWALVLVAQIALFAFCFQGMAACTSEDCSRYTQGASVSVAGVILATMYFVMRVFDTTRLASRRTKRVLSVEFGLAAVNFTLAAVGAALLSGSNDEYASVNVYFACWISFFVGLNLFLRYVDAYLSPGSMMTDAEYDYWRKIHAPEKPPLADQLVRRQSTSSTAKTESSFKARVEDAAAAEAHLESMVASSHSSSQPFVYLDKQAKANEYDASALSNDAEFQTLQTLPPPPPPMRSTQRHNRSDPSVHGGTVIDQRHNRSDPSVHGSTGIDPIPSVSTTSKTRSTSAGPKQRSIRKLMPPPPPPPARKTSINQRTFVAPPARKSPINQRPSIDPKDSSSSTPSTHYPTAKPQRSLKMDANAPRPPAPHPPQRRRASVTRSSRAESVSTTSEFEFRVTEEHPKQMLRPHVRSETLFPGYAPTTSAADDDPKQSNYSLFPESFSEEVMAAMAQVHETQETSPSTDPPPTIEPSLSSRMQIRPTARRPSGSLKEPPLSRIRTRSPGLKPSESTKSNRTNKSKHSGSLPREGNVSRASGPSKISRRQSLNSSRKSSTTHGSRGPPTLSDDDEDPAFDNDNLTQSPSSLNRPLNDISMDNVTTVSDPTMDGFEERPETSHIQPQPRSYNPPLRDEFA